MKTFISLACRMTGGSMGGWGGVGGGWVGFQMQEYMDVDTLKCQLRLPDCNENLSDSMISSVTPKYQISLTSVQRFASYLCVQTDGMTDF